MITLDIVNKKLMGLDGVESQDGDLGKVVANSIARASKSKDPVKMFELARRFWKCEKLELDDSDYELVRKTVKEDQIMTAWGSGQTLVMLTESEIR